MTSSRAARRLRCSPYSALEASSGLFMASSQSRANILSVVQAMATQWSSLVWKWPWGTAMTVPEPSRSRTLP